MTDEIRALLRETASFSVPVETLSETDDLYLAGLSSLEVVTLIVALERHFAIHFSDDMLEPKNFRTIAAIGGVLQKHRVDA